MLDALFQLDGNILLFIQDHFRTDVLTFFFRTVTSLGDGGRLWIILTTLLLLYPKTRKAGACCALALVINAILVNVTIKPLVNRTRPYVAISQLRCLINHPGDASFPSGHSSASMAFAVAIWYKKEWEVAIPSMIVALLICASRLYVGVHYPTDVLGGMLVGIICGILSCKIIEKIGKNQKKALTM